MGAKISKRYVSVSIRFGTLKFFLTQDHMRPEISKCYSSLSFHPMPAKLWILATIVEYRLLLFLAIGQVKKFCGTLKF